MAQSRLERIGTIYTRVSLLMKGGAWKEADKPLWYDIYTNFPPKYEPCYGRTVQHTPIRKIFYEEDIIRAQFHKNNKYPSLTSLINQDFDSPTQRFILLCQQLKKDGVPQEDLYEQAKKIYSMHAQSLKTKKYIIKDNVKDDIWQNDATENNEQPNTNEPIPSSEKLSQKPININILDLFQEKK